MTNNYMQESNDTGVIYKITNTINNKVYVGKAFSFVNNGNSGYIRHGHMGRFANHVKAAKNNSMDCPLLYEDMNRCGVEHFKVEALEVCSKADLKVKEEAYIILLNTNDPNVGYNYFVGSKKPQHKDLCDLFEEKKAKSNVMRAVGGKMKKQPHNIGLPENITYRCKKDDIGNILSEGYFAQIKLNGKLYNKAFLSKKYTMEERLERAQAFLEDVKNTCLNG
jgi:group I intron endonuclease